MTRGYSILAIICVVCSANALADDWVQIGKNDEDGYILYMDKASMGRTEQIWRVWFLLDFRNTMLTLEEKPYRSIKELNYINCAEETKAALAQYTYTENMAKGEPIASLTVDEKSAMFTEVIPGIGPAEAKLAAVCKE